MVRDDSEMNEIRTSHDGRENRKVREDFRSGAPE